MIFNRNSRLILILVVGLAVGLPAGCVYYNTFYNAKAAFNEAEKTRKSSRLRGGRIKSDLYEKAIEKSLKVIENYPNSKYYDDALYVLGVSYYHVGKFIASERRIRELLANYPKSKYVDEAELYLAKVKLERQDEEEAMTIFEKIFQSDIDKSFKGEAAIALGDYHFDQGNWDKARDYYMALRDSLGTEDEKKSSQMMIADSYFNRFRFQDALSAYLQLLGMEPDKGGKYHALYGAAMSSFRLMRIHDGLDYLRTLAEDETYYDSVGVLKICMAEGHEYDEDLTLAEDLYTEVLEQERNRKIAGEAAYRLGLMYQFDYDNLLKARDYYDQTVDLNKASDYGRDALERSADIGKIETFRRTGQLDSMATQEVIDEAAFTQYQLAELYWMNLNKLDSAIIEMRYVVDSFPTSKYAPKAIIALSQMYMETADDPYKGHGNVRQIPQKYPGSDYIPEALEVIGMTRTAMDTGYAELYLNKAEDFLVDEQNIDSARYYYQYIVDNFPKSKYYVQAKFALIWLTETYNNPGDSSIYYAYVELADSFPNSVWAEQAEAKISLEPSRISQLEPEVKATQDTLLEIDNLGPEAEQEAQADTTEAVDPLTSVYFGPNGERIGNITIEPVEIREEFIYPVEAYSLGWEGDLYFQIFLDFSGEVVDYILKIRCESEEINREASKTVESMIFDPLRIPQEQQDAWMVYKFQVRKPDHIR